MDSPRAPAIAKSLSAASASTQSGRGRPATTWAVKRTNPLAAGGATSRAAARVHVALSQAARRSAVGRLAVTMT